MRLSIALTALASLFAAAPALADNLPAGPAALTLTSAERADAERPGIVIGREFRLRTSQVIAATLAPDNERPADLLSRTHKRFASSMVDFYPVDGQGFHLSAGMKLYKSPYGAMTGATGATALLAGSRSMIGGGQRFGRRFVPAATVGYTEGLGSNMSLNLEGGAMMGSNVPTTRMLTSGSDRLGRAGGSPNGVVRMTFGFKFR